MSIQQEQYDKLLKSYEKQKVYIENIKSGNLLRCRQCGKVKKYSEFYTATDVTLDSCGRMSICSSCINTYCNDTLGGNEQDFQQAIYRTCENYNVAYNNEAFNGLMSGVAAIVENKGKFTANTLFGKYKSKLMTICKNNGLSTFTFTYASQELRQNQVNADFKNDIEKQQHFEQLKKFWRLDMAYPLLVKMQDLYDFIDEFYKSQSNMHVIALQEYCVAATLRDDAHSRKKSAEAKDYGAMADKAAMKAKIDPKNLSKADLSDGLNSISEIAQAFTKHRDVIRVFPKYTAHPNDVLDFNLYQYINYVRKMKGLEEVQYHEIWKFYDKKVEEFIEASGDINGIFTEFDAEKAHLAEKRERVTNFIKEDLSKEEGEQ